MPITPVGLVGIAAHHEDVLEAEKAGAPCGHRATQSHVGTGACEKYVRTLADDRVRRDDVYLILLHHIPNAGVCEEAVIQRQDECVLVKANQPTFVGNLPQVAGERRRTAKDADRLSRVTVGELFQFHP